MGENTVTFAAYPGKTMIHPAEIEYKALHRQVEQ